MTFGKLLKYVVKASIKAQKASEKARKISERDQRAAEKVRVRAETANLRTAHKAAENELAQQLRQQELIRTEADEAEQLRRDHFKSNFRIRINLIVENDDSWGEQRAG